MDLDEFQRRWAAQDMKLDQLLRLTLREAGLRQARSALQQFRTGLALEWALNALAVLALGAFIADQLGALRFVLPALVLDVAAVALVATTARQWFLAGEVNYDGPVTESQRQLERLRLLRIRVTKWVLLLSPLLWTPLLIVGLKVLFGVDAYAVPGVPYLVANLLFGVAFIPLMGWAARRWAPRLERSGWARRWAEALAGTSLSEASGRLASITAFEREGELQA